MVYSVVYMGYSCEMLSFLLDSQQYEVKKVVGVRNRISKEEYALIRSRNLEYKELASKNEVDSLETFIGDVDVVIMYKFEYILPQYLIKKYRIINFHGGSLRENRGAHAVVRSILNMDTQTCLSMYQLTGGIDLGILIKEYWVDISSEENEISLNKKLVTGIPELLLNLKQYLEGEREGVAVTEGTYWPKIEEKDFTINLETDTCKKMCCKIRSQEKYRGAICYINEKKYYIKKYQYNIRERTDIERRIKLEYPQIMIYEKEEELILFLEDCD